MKESVFDVLMYLFENYYMDEDAEPSADRESLHGELLDAGFNAGEVYKAFEWLEGLAEQRESPPAMAQTLSSLRIFSDLEQERLDSECRGFLLFMEQMGILSPISREMVMDRVMALDTGEIDLDQLKWIILMVLFNQPGQEAAYAWMEDYVFENMAATQH